MTDTNREIFFVSFLSLYIISFCLGVFFQAYNISQWMIAGTSL